MLPEPSDLRVVLVEDRPEDAALTLRCLQRHGFMNPIDVFSDGESALTALLMGRHATLPAAGPGPPRLILLDLRLPGIDGFEVVRRLRSDPWTSDAVVVVLASPGETASVTAAYAAGADSFLFKPIDFGSLVDATAELGLGWRLQVPRDGNGDRRLPGALRTRRPAAR